MGLFFNRKKDKKPKKVTISIENWEDGLLSKDYLFNEFASKFMYWCDGFYMDLEKLMQAKKDNVDTRNILLNSYNTNTINKFDKINWDLHKDDREALKKQLALRNVGMMQTITVLQYLDIFAKTDADYTIDNILNHFYSSEELQKKQLEHVFAKIRPREVVDGYILLLQKIREDFEPFDENEDFYNELGLLRDKDGNLLEPDWYSYLIKLPDEVVEALENFKE